jgi:hypothetical protein
MTIDWQKLEVISTKQDAHERILGYKSLNSSGQILPFEVLVQVFRKIPISNQEKVALVEFTGVLSHEAHESWLFDQITKSDQNVGVALLRHWAKGSQHSLASKLEWMIKLPGLPQRLSYTILDCAPQSFSPRLTEAVVELGGWNDFSPAYHCLLLEKAIVNRQSSVLLTRLALDILNRNKSNHHSDDKSLISAMIWLLYAKSDIDFSVFSKIDDSYGWVNFAKQLQLKHQSDLLFLTEEIPANASKNKMPSSRNKKDKEQPFNRLLEIPIWTLACYLNRVKDAASQDALDRFAQMVTSHFRQATHQTSKFEDVKPEFSSKNESRSELQNWLFRSSNEVIEEKPDQDSFWSYVDQIRSPKFVMDLKVLASLTKQARKISGWSQLVYLDVLGQFKGSDDAVLKLMDHIRSVDEQELILVSNSLSRIGTNRSLMELISMLTRPNASLNVKQSVVQNLGKHDLTSLQHEIRTTLNDIDDKPIHGNPLSEIKEALQGMLNIELPRSLALPRQSRESETTDRALDIELAQKIKIFDVLSSEVKRALRTALFFEKTTGGGSTSLAIDLSPLVDMQYKAMELLYREKFEDLVNRSMKSGEISRKLDNIGYARPIPHKMDEFESYVASLPIVRDIPFFSKFKLRKMLRAMCQFEPGKRFTLDGLKAFGLFFLCFGRKSCKFGLADLVSTPFDSDEPLIDYVKELHIFQDLRNRAAHEGFHPDARNDTSKIWVTTAKCVELAYKDFAVKVAAQKSFSKAS